jgi:hypothetical protein
LSVEVQNVPGFWKMVNDIKNPYWAMQKGVTHALENIRAYPPASVKKIDMTIDEDGVSCDTCRFDLELDKDISDGGVRFVEFKSYKLTSIEKYLSVKQLKAYLESSSSIGEMKYVFNKLETPDVTAVKTEFKKVFEKDPKGTFEIMGEGMRTSLGVEDFDQFEALIKNTDSALYSFIEVK